MGEKSHKHRMKTKSEQTYTHWTRSNPDEGREVKVKFEECDCGAVRSRGPTGWTDWCP